MMEKMYEIHANICKVFTSPVRLKILSLLREGEMTVNELAERLGLSQPNTSQHLGCLRDKNILQTRRDGTNVHYSIGNKKILQAMDIMHQIIIEQLKEDSELIDNIKRGEYNGKSDRSD